MKERQGKHHLEQTEQPYYLIEGNMPEVFDEPKIEEKPRHISHEIKLALSGVLFRHNKEIAADARKSIVRKHG